MTPEEELAEGRELVYEFLTYLRANTEFTETEPPNVFIQVKATKFKEGLDGFLYSLADWADR